MSILELFYQLHWLPTKPFWYFSHLNLPTFALSKIFVLHGLMAKGVIE